MMKKKARSCNSHIPTELVFENILVRVPAKSLMRFKLVCKLWRSTILHDRRFHLSHRSLSPSRPSLLAFVGTYYPLTWYKPSPPIHIRFPIICSRHGIISDYYDMQDLMREPVSLMNRFVCASISSSASASTHWEKAVEEDYCTTEVVNGLVCFYSKNPSNNIYLCNLSTSETMTLPPPPSPRDPRLPVSTHPCPYFLGFDDINKVYKLLQIQKECSYNKDNSKILTIRYNQSQNQNQNQNQAQNCWRNTRVRHSVGFRRSYCFKSALYWIYNFGLIRFDLNKESYSTIHFPLVPDHVGTPLRAFRAPIFSMQNHHWGRYYDSLEAGLTKIGGRLALTHSSVGATEFTIWLLDDDDYEQKLIQLAEYPPWDKITIQIPVHLRDPFPPSFPPGPLPAWASNISWSSFITIPAGTLPGTKKIVFTIGRGMVYKGGVGLRMPVYTYDLESETWETLDNDYLHADASSIEPAAYKEYSQIYYLHEENIMPLKDILGLYDENEAYLESMKKMGIC